MVKLFIFDLDGTLVDSRRDLAASVNAMREAFRLKALSVERVTAYVGEGMRLLIERSLAGAKGVPIEEAMRIFSAHYADHCLDRTALYPGVKETLGELQKRAKLAVVSNKPEMMTVKILSALGVAQWLAVMIGGDSVRSRKPDPEPVAEVLRRTGVLPGEALMVGDGWTDIAAGKAAGVTTCYVPGIGDAAKVDEAGPDYRIGNIADLMRRF